MLAWACSAGRPAPKNQGNSFSKTIAKGLKGAQLVNSYQFTDEQVANEIKGALASKGGSVKSSKPAYGKVS